MRHLRPHHVGFILLATAVGAVCLRLGVWQLDRLSDRRLVNAEIRERQAMPLVDLNTMDLQTDSLAYRGAQGRGSFDVEHQVVLSNRALNGEPGAHLIVPLRLEGQPHASLVDRGWLPLSQTDPQELAGLPSAGTVVATGILLPSQLEPRWKFMADRTPYAGEPRLSSWRVLNIAGIQAQMPYPLLPLYLAATQPSADAALPKPDVTIDLLEARA